MKEQSKMKESKKMLSRIKMLTLAVALIIGGTAYAAELVDISGTVLYDGSPVCAMVLANGQYMFTDAEDGEYVLEVPLDENGQITLFAFCDGLAPFKRILTPEEAADFTINMESALPGSSTMTVTHELTSAGEAGWVTMNGTVMYGDIPLCAMILANGQHMFSCDPDGEYELVVPLDENGQITLFGFVDGFAPFKEIVEGEVECTLEVIEWAPTGSVESANLKPTITATFRSSCGADIDMSSIVMLIDGDPVTPTMTGGGSEVTVTYTPLNELVNFEEYELSVTAQDVNGNVGEKTWEIYLYDY